MNEKDQFHACMRQAEFAIRLFDGRRQYEWKVTLGLWALFAGAIGFLRGTALPWWIPVMIVFGHTFLWLRGTWVANENDKAIAFHFRREAENILLDASHKLSPSPGKVRGFRWGFGFLFSWSTLFQTIATTALAWLSYTLVKPN